MDPVAENPDVVIDVVVDVANVVGSRPDGWWRDRAGASQRLLARLAGLPGTSVRLPDGTDAVVGRLVAVTEGQANAVVDVPGIDVVRAPRDGDSTVVDLASACEHRVLVVSADRGLRARLPAAAITVGPRWLTA